MSECERFREMTIERDPAEDPRLHRHAARCADCREQLETERALRQLFREVARPAPSPHFDRTLRQRLRAEREQQRRNSWRLMVMQGYWVAASAACVVVMLLTRWPSDLPPAPVVCLAAIVLGTTLLAPLVLFLTLRIGPLGLIAETINAFRR